MHSWSLAFLLKKLTICFDCREKLYVSIENHTTASGLSDSSPSHCLGAMCRLFITCMVFVPTCQLGWVLLLCTFCPSFTKFSFLHIGSYCSPPLSVIWGSLPRGLVAAVWCCQKVTTSAQLLLVLCKYCSPQEHLVTTSEEMFNLALLCYNLPCSQNYPVLSFCLITNFLLSFIFWRLLLFSLLVRKNIPSSIYFYYLKFLIIVIWIHFNLFLFLTFFLEIIIDPQEMIKIVQRVPMYLYLV